MNNVRTLFIGSGDFAITALKALQELNFVDLVGVVTQPDRPVGRKQILTPTPVGEYLNTTEFPEEKIRKPEKIKAESKEILDYFKPELILVASFGQIIPDNILDYPRFSCLNLHGSILPKLRGAVPVQMAILQGLEKTGVTLQRMVSEMDKGPIVSTKEIAIENDETSETLMQKLSVLGAEIVHQNLDKWIKGELKEEAQNEENATYCYKTDLSKENAEIKFETGINLAERMVRAFNPWPVAWFRLEDGKRVKVFSAEIGQGYSAKVVEGSLGLANREGVLTLILNNGELVLNEIQLEGKKRGPGSSYLYLAG